MPEPAIWITKEGTAIPVNQMSLSHLVNAWKWVIRQGWKLERVLPEVSPRFLRRYRERIDTGRYWAFVFAAEIERRGFRVPSEDEYRDGRFTGWLVPAEWDVPYSGQERELENTGQAPMLSKLHQLGSLIKRGLTGDEPMLGSPIRKRSTNE